MNESKKTIEIKVERTIPAPLAEVFDAWLNPKILALPGMRPTNCCSIRK